MNQKDAGFFWILLSTKQKHKKDVKKRLQMYFFRHS